MEKIDTFNIRVYALIIKENRILVLDEMYVGEQLHKLPGGGLEFGEGLLQCLERELKEELNLTIKGAKHFYTQEDFIQSKFKNNEQLLTVYYKVEVEDLKELKILEDSIQQIKWIELNDKVLEYLQLPVDKIVANKLLDK